MGNGGAPSRGASGSQPFIFVSGGEPFGGEDVGDGLGGLDELLAGMGVGGMPKRRRCSARSSPTFALPSGTKVVVHGLTGAQQHNGKSGAVLDFDDVRGGYQVEVEGSASALSLRPQCLTQQCSVEVAGL